MKKDTGADLLEELMKDEMGDFSILRESLEDLNLYISEIENMYKKLDNDITDDDYNLLLYKLGILEKNMTELNKLISAALKNNNSIDKSKLS